MSTQPSMRPSAQHSLSTPLSPARERRAATREFMRGPLPILVACLLWGSTGTAASFAPEGANPAAVGCAGLVFGGLLLCLSTRGCVALVRTATARDRVALLVGAAAVAAYPLTFYPAVSRTGVAVATVVALGSAPVFAGLVERAPFGPLRRVATAAAVTGCALLVVGQETGGVRADALGVGLALVAGLAYAAYASVAARLISRGHAARPALAVMFTVAAAGVAPLVVADGWWLTEPRGAAVALHLSVLTTCVAYTLFGLGLRHTTAVVATSLTLAEPAAAAVLGVAVLGEQLAWVSWAGLAVVGVSLGVMSRG
ncbi:DMT family transporter [Yinghuangia sp. YIM S09857]|uniref:DMT family transporter n=1 Tax=Yinghuangia sp. YIM S09857 TaxID=3436929 RepID=UPI003F52B0EB